MNKYGNCNLCGNLIFLIFLIFTKLKSVKSAYKSSGPSGWSLSSCWCLNVLYLWQDAFILETGQGIYIWEGKKSTRNEKNQAIKDAQVSAV